VCRLPWPPLLRSEKQRRRKRPRRANLIFICQPHHCYEWVSEWMSAVWLWGAEHRFRLTPLICGDVNCYPL
jgi:hypothetical protein